MTLLERRAWTMLVTAALAYGWYVTDVLARAGGPAALPDVPYVAALVRSVVAAVVVNIVVEIVLSMRPGASRQTDVRDAEIGRFGDHVGQAFVVIGAIAAMLLAMWERDPFWVANCIYLGFVLSAVVGSLAKVAAYRTGLPW